MKGERWTQQFWIYPLSFVGQNPGSSLAPQETTDKLEDFSGEISQCRTPEVTTCRKTKAFIYWNISDQGLNGGSEHSLQTPVSPNPKPYKFCLKKSPGPWYSLLTHFTSDFNAHLPVWLTALPINEILLNMYALNRKTIMAPGKLHSIRQLPVFLKPLNK